MLAILLFSAIAVRSQRLYPPVIEGAKEVTYKTVDDTQLSLWIFDSGNKQSNKPAIVFFFGGGWNAGSPSQFVDHCEYLSNRGMVAIVADYRVKSRNNVREQVCFRCQIGHALGSKACC